MLPLGPAWAQSPAAEGDSLRPPGADGPRPDAIVTVTAADGRPVTIQIYRPNPPTTAAAILISDWQAPPATCWNALLATLLSDGCEVLIALAGDSLSASDPARARAVPTQAELVSFAQSAAHWSGAARRANVPLFAVAVGWGGLALPSLLGAEPRLGGVAWIAPRSSDQAHWDLAGREDVTLLLLAGDADLEGSAVAMNLFSRFNDSAELRLFGSDQWGCALAQRAWVRGALQEWWRSLPGR